MNETTNDGSNGLAPQRPVGPYWEDEVYRYVSRRHRDALAAGSDVEASRFEVLMQQLAEGSMPDELYGRLDAQARDDRKKRRQERKRRQPRRPVSPSPSERTPPVNVADLKKRIFNRQVSRENVIKALEALPSAERKAVIATLPPGLRRKLGGYLKGTGQ
jgi:hypothetical protein